MGYEQSIELNDGIVRIALVILLSRSDKINRIEGCGPEVLIPLAGALNREKRHGHGGLPQLPMQKSKDVKEYEASIEKLKGNQIESKLERNLLLNMLVGNKTFDIELPI